jgi:polyketide cyclase/dehydrase/lipid transport protein
MLLKILIALGAVVAAFAAFVALQPSDYRVARSATIAAPASAVFAQVNDFHKWDAWSPWAKLDPNAKTAFEGPSAGEGAVFAWAGNKEIGEGRMTLTQSRPGELIRIKLDFVQPMAGTSTAEFTFKPEGDRGHLGHVRPEQFRRPGDLPVHEPGQDARRLFREGPSEPEGGGGSGGARIVVPVSGSKAELFEEGTSAGPSAWR